MLHWRMKKGKDEMICVERLSSISFEKTVEKKSHWKKPWKKNLEKNQFFSMKKPPGFVEKKQTLNVWNEKTPKEVYMVGAHHAMGGGEV